jgi:hypothetical protein
MALQHFARHHRMRSVRIVKQGGKAGIPKVYRGGEGNQQNNRGSRTPLGIAHALCA